jgi:Domain of unknown function (DUF5668)
MDAGPEGVSAMSDRVNCQCARCRIRALTWPVILITLGVLFFVAQYSHRYSFEELWPILLIAIGALKLIEALASNEGHIERPR